MENQNLRMEKGSEAPSERGAGSTYFIPRDDMPEGIVSGSKIELVIEALANVDEQGLILKVDKLYFKNVDTRDDPTQKGLEEDLEAESKKK